MQSEQGAPRGIWAARLAFAVVLGLFPVQMGIALLVDEPYPALFQPSFAGTPLSDDGLRRSEPAVTLRFVDGGTAEVPWGDVLPKTRLHSLVVFRAAFESPKKAQAPATRAWLRQSLDEKYGHGRVETMTVRWFENTYSPWTREKFKSTPEATVVVQVAP